MIEFKILSEEELSKLSEEEKQAFKQAYINRLREINQNVIDRNNRLNQALKDLDSEWKGQ